MKRPLIFAILIMGIACISITALAKPLPLIEIISFNDGTQAGCAIVELTPDVTKEDLSDSFLWASKQVEKTGCVNFHFRE